MKTKKLRLITIVIVIALLAGCTAEAQSWYALGSSVGRDENSSGLTSNTSLYDVNFINEDMLVLIGSTNVEVKLRYPGECFAYGAGMGNPRAAWFSPYILIDFYPSPMAVFNENIHIEQYDMDGDYYLENPYIDDLEIMQIWLKGDYDASAHAVTAQDSLRQFFTTQELITYELLTEKLSQKPNLTHNPNAYYTKPGEDLGLHNRTLGEAIQGGYYEAIYDISGIPVQIWFVKSQGAYIALEIKIGEMDEDKLSGNTNGYESAPQTDQSISQPTNSSSNPQNSGFDEDTYPDVLATEDLPIFTFFEPINYSTFYAWIQGAPKELLIPSFPNELGRGYRSEEGFVYEGENGADIRITQEQQENIIQQLQDIIAQYKSGEYPLEPEFMDYSPYTDSWPPDAPMDIVVQLEDIYYCTYTEYREFGIGVFFQLDNKWLMWVTISGYPNSMELSANNDYWNVGTRCTFLTTDGIYAP